VKRERGKAALTTATTKREERKILPFYGTIGKKGKLNAGYSGCLGAGQRKKKGVLHDRSDRKKKKGKKGETEGRAIPKGENVSVVASCRHSGEKGEFGCLAGGGKREGPLAEASKKKTTLSVTAKDPTTSP